MSIPVNENDPRVKRTRQLLLQAFIALLEERQNIHSISVQEIAVRATVNRATFYAHFEDKYALLESWIREKFHRVLGNQLPASSSLQRSTLCTLIELVFDFLAHVCDHLKLADREFEPLFEMAFRQEVSEILLAWLKPVPLREPLQEETRETIALILSWAIVGPAVQWSRGERTIPAEKMIHSVLAVVIAGLSPVITVI